MQIKIVMDINDNDIEELREACKKVEEELDNLRAILRMRLISSTHDKKPESSKTRRN